MAGLSYRRGGWELRYRDRSGKERTERFRGDDTSRPPLQAVERKAEVENGLRRGTWVPPEERLRRFGDLFDAWWAARAVSPSRMATERNRADLHVLPHWREWPIGSIRPSDIDDWIASLTKKIGPSSVRHCYGLLRGPLRRAVRDGIITDPCIDIRLPKKADVRKNFDDVLSAREVHALLTNVVADDPKYAALRTNGRYLALLTLACWCGPRWNETIGLRVCDLNPLRKELVLGRICVNQIGATHYYKRYTKTADTRAIPVPAPVMVALMSHVGTYLPADAGREDFLFLTPNGTHPLRSNFQRDVLKPALDRAGLGGRGITWLSLRHSAASLMFDAGLTVFDAQKRLGHRSPIMTMEIYTHLMRERFDEGRRLMETYIGDSLEAARQVTAEPAWLPDLPAPYRHQHPGGS